MGIREIIEKARRAQQDNSQLHPVQLEIPKPTLWASDDERLERFRSETFEFPLGSFDEETIRLAHRGSRASLPSFGGVKSARDIQLRTEAIPGRPGWRIDSEGREWYSAAWL